MLQQALLGMIRFYQRRISPMTPPSCRYLPTCSAYAKEAITRYGAFRGSWLAWRRLLRCHPFGGHGYDPVPLLNDVATESVEEPNASSKAAKALPGAHQPKLPARTSLTQCQESTTWKKTD